MTDDPGPVRVIGAGGHAAVVIATLQDLGVTIEGLYDDAADRWGTAVLGVPIRGSIAQAAEGGSHPAVLALGDNRLRQHLAGQLGLRWITAIHPRAYVHSSVEVGAGSVIFAGAVIQPRARLGEHVIVNTAASVDHDCDVGPFAHLAPGVHLSGGVRVGSGTLIGIGAALRPGISVGEWATVGAGAAVVSDIPDRVIAVGVPATPRPHSPAK